MEREGYDDPFAFNPDRYINHHKLANDYAGSADYKLRDKSPNLIMISLLTLLYITTDTVLVVECAQVSTWPSEINGESWPK